MDFKIALKEARDAINSKKFKEAQEICKSILKHDKQNYMALVLLGVSLQESEQALMAFRKAISLDQKKILAWQGLANYYEKKNDVEFNLQLLKIYEEMLKLDIDEAKVDEIFKKIALMNGSCSSQSVELLFRVSKESNNKLSSFAHKCAIEITKHSTITDKITDEVISFLRKLVKENQQDSLLVFSYAKLLKDQVNFNDFMDEMIKTNFFNKNTDVTKWLCKELFNKFVHENERNYVEILSSYLNECHGTYEADLVEAMVLFTKQMYGDAYSKLINYLNFNEINFDIICFLIDCCAHLKKWHTMEKLILKIQPYFNGDKEKSIIQKSLLISHFNQENFNGVVDIGKTFPLNNLTTLEKAMYIQALIETQQPASQELEELKGTPYFDLLTALQYLLGNNVNESIKLLESLKSDYYLKFLLLGICYWKIENYESCQLLLLKAAKLNPDNSQTFLYLGHYYNHMNDTEKAKKCYLKSFNISNNIEAAKCLSKLYRKTGCHKENYDLLIHLTQGNNKGEVWPHLQMGLHYLSVREWDNAIINLRSVIRKTTDYVEVWEALADAYYFRGSYTSALKCYKKALDFGSVQKIYSNTQIGNIQILLGEYEEAIVTYKSVLHEEPNSIIALKGIADTYYNVAIEKFISNLFGAARSDAQHCIDYLTRIIKLQRSHCSIWKLLADAFFIITKLPRKYSYANVDYSIISETGKDYTQKIKTEIFQLAVACYCRAINIQSDVSLYYDIAITYYEYFKEEGDDYLWQRSVQAAKYCVKHKSKEWQYWNLLGLLAMTSCIKRYDLAQHCFIKALHCDQTNATCWTNLGILYLKLDLYVYANNAFKRAQQSNPSYLQSWIGQAMIAESIREEEAMDLFRHSTQLGYHRESAFGYADWVCRTLQNLKSHNDYKYRFAIKNMYAIPVALDLMTWLCEYETDNPCALTVRGILQERRGLLNSAHESFKRTINVLGNDCSDIAYINFGRLSIRLDNSEQAIKSFKNVKEASIESACGLALALNKVGNYEESYSTYGTAVHWLANNELDKADLLVAMASMVYLLKNTDDAKTLLFQSIQVSPTQPTPHSLFATCALGLLHSDSSLSKLALNELKIYENVFEFSHDIAFLQSYLHYQESKIKESMKAISQSIHKFPNKAELWFGLTQYILLDTNLHASTASVCSQKAICSGRGCVDITKMLAVASLCEQLCSNKTLSKQLAQKAIHIYPHRIENWAVLISTLVLNFMNNDSTIKLLKALVANIKKKFQMTPSLGYWFTIVEQTIEN